MFIPATLAHSHRRRALAKFVLKTAVLAAAPLLSSAQTESPAPTPPLAPLELPAQTPTEGPWGMAPSASGRGTIQSWMPKMAAIKVDGARIFPEWRSVEPAPGQWRWGGTDELVQTALENKIEINALLMGSAPGTKAVHAFPMNDLLGWANYVSASVTRYHRQIHHWEIWNEGNAGFNDGKNNAEDYAKMAAAAYAAAKKADPQARIGLSTASFDPAYLMQVISALKKQGTPDNFDYLCVHPYELGGLLRSTPDGELPYLWMTRLLRDLLKTTAPERVNVPIWVTEIGVRINAKKAGGPTPEDQARALVKFYTLSLAQGIFRTQWFEPQDNPREEPGFGILSKDGEPLLGYKALQSLTGVLGAKPASLGWVALGKNGRGYGFVFQGSKGPILVAWMPLGAADEPITFAGPVQVVDPLIGQETALPAGQTLSLTNAATLIQQPPAALVAQAKANAANPYPWGGNYTGAKSVSLQFGAEDAQKGIFPTTLSKAEIVTFPDGTKGALVAANKFANFFVHPSFAAVTDREFYVRFTIRRQGLGNIGMNFFYEMADTKARTPYKNPQQWYTLPKDEGWQTRVWHVTDASFSKMWGFDFYLAPENSQPFVIGKVEVSKTPF